MPHDPIEPREGELAYERDLAAEADMPVGAGPKRRKGMRGRNLLGQRRPPGWFGVVMIGGILAAALLLAMVMWVE